MKKQWIVKMFVLFLMFFLLSQWTMTSKADFGSYSGDSDYGGSFSDSGSSWGDYGGSSWSDNDNDNYVFFGGSGGFGSGGGGGAPLSFGMGFFILVIIIVIIALRSSKTAKAMKRNAPGSVAPGAMPTAAANLRPIEEYKQMDPAFDVETFKDKMSNLYVQMQNAWTKKDITSLQPYFTDAFFTQMDRQLQSMKKNRQTNYVDRIAVLGVDVRGFMQTGTEDLIVVQMMTRIVDYTLNDETGELVSGDQKAEKFMTYEWILARTKGQQTKEAVKMQAIHCPSCGAPVSINETAKCPYCGNVITVDSHDFVITAIKGISQVSGR